MRRPGPLCLLASILSCAGSRPAASLDPGPIRITLVSTNDLHGWVQPHETRLEDGSLLRSGGVAVFASYLRRLREENPGGVVLVDAGDLFQGTQVANLSEGEVVIAAYNALGYDAAAIGNHEFDYGPVGPRSAAIDPEDDPYGAIEARAAQARFPLLARNVHLKKNGERPRFLAEGGVAMLERKGLKIGLLGLLTPMTPQVTNPINVSGLTFTNMAQEAKQAAELLRARGADLVVAVVHAGGSCSNLDHPNSLASCERSSEALELLESLPKGIFDAMVAGHTHSHIGHFVRGTPVVEAGSLGTEFAVVELAIDPATRRPISGETRIRSGLPICERVIRETGDCNPKRWKPGMEIESARFDGVPVVPDPKMDALLAPFMERVAAAQVRSLKVRLPERLMRDSRRESTLGNALADALRQMERADVVLLNSGGLRADLPRGELTYGKFYEVFPFDNTIATLTLTGAEIVELLEALLASGHGVPQTSGLRFEAARCSGRAGITSIRFQDGHPFDRAATYRLVTSDFLALGGDGTGKVLGKVPAARKEFGHRRELNMRDALAADIEKRGGEMVGRIDWRMRLTQGSGAACP
jgi:5'-nucleotidase